MASTQILFEEQRGIDASKTERIGEGTAYFAPSRLVGNIIQCATWIRWLVIDGGRQYGIVDGFYGKDSLNTASRPNTMARSAFGGGDRNILGVITKNTTNSHTFIFIV